MVKISPLIPGATALLFAALRVSAGAERAPRPVTLRGHTSEVGAVAFFPDGRKILSASDDRTLKVWDAATGALLATWTGHAAEVGDAAVLPDGATALSISEDRTLRLWDTSSGATLAAFPGHDGQVRMLSVAADGRTAATLSYDGEIKLWDLPARKETRVLHDGKDAHPMDIALSPDGTKLLAGLWDEALWLWDVKSGERVAVWNGHRHPVLTVAFSPDGERALSGGRDNTVRLWSVADGKQLAVWKGHTSYVHAAVFSPDGRTALSGGSDFTVRKWDVASGKELAVRRGHQGDIRSIAFSPDGSRAVSASDDYTLKLWDMTERTPADAPSALDVSGTAREESGRRAVSAEEIGRMLFFDRRLSGDTTVNCAACHDPKNAFADGRALSPGYPDTLYFRNTPTLLNAAAQKSLYWDGRFPGDDLPSLIRDHIAEAHFMNADGRMIVEKLRQAPGYVERFRAVFGAEPGYGQILEALTAFLRTLRSGESPYDRYLAGDHDALSRAARRGYRLFNGKAGCAQCHNGPLLTDGKFHDRRVPENPDIFAEPLRHISLRRFFKLSGVEDYRTLRRDIGLSAVTKNKQDQGRFKTPPLREVARTAPYMHNGTLKTLEDAVAFENPRLSKRQVRDIVEFLKTLNSELPSVEAPPLPGYEVLARRARAETAGAKESAPSGARKEFPPLGPLPEPPVPQDNPLTPSKVELGELLFFDQRLSGNGETYCGACHAPQMGWGDDSALSQGYEGMLHWRNSQTLLNVAHYAKLNWDGNKTSLEEQARTAITSNISGNGDPTMIEERLAESPEYVARFKKAFGVDRPHFEGVLKAIASFERAVPVSRNVPFDRYMRGEKTALCAAARRGMELFQGKAGCIRCHNGPLASDQGFHATGVPRNPDFDRTALRQVALRYQHVLRGVPEDIYRDAEDDYGLGLNTLRAEDMGKFRTPSLRELKFTAPYMHNGTLRTLPEVVDFYDRGGGESPNKSPLLRPLRLEAGEKEDLIAFLESLSGDRIVVEKPNTPEPNTSKGHR